MTTLAPTNHDWRVRHFVYTFWVAHERPPETDEISAEFDVAATEARDSLDRLDAAHHLLLDADSGRILMAFPLSAVPTLYHVQVNGRGLWANCACDSLGIPAMLQADATITARDPLTQTAHHYTVRGGALHASAQYHVHFALPVRQWYDNLVHT